MLSWISATCFKVKRRERKLITFSGIAPDIDGFGALVDPVAKQFGYYTSYWFEYHHQLHNVSFAVFLASVGFFLSKANKLKVAIIIFCVVHLHYLCDLIGSKSPDGYQWPIPYLSPFSQSIQLTWEYQWELNAWPNIMIAVMLSLVVVTLSRKKVTSPFELISARLNDTFLKMVGVKVL